MMKTGDGKTENVKPKLTKQLIKQSQFTNVLSVSFKFEKENHKIQMATVATVSEQHGCCSL